MESGSLLFILSGPAGSGKTTLCHRLLSEFRTLRRAVTVTTRAPREGEQEGKDYFFLSREGFEKTREAGGFLESALVHGRAYGTLESEVVRHFRSGVDVLLSVDVQGMRQIRDRSRELDWLGGRVVTIFISPPSIDELRDRLRRRGTDDEREIERRIETARREIASAGEFDYLLETHTREEDFDRIRAVYLAEKMRVRP
ncbi:MAG: guanylate kinase [Puniceicoccaceae bacterium]